MITSLDIEKLVQEITDEVVKTLGSCSGGCASCPNAAQARPATQSGCSGCGACDGKWHCTARKTGDVGELVQLGASRIGAGIGIPKVATDIASLIDHTLLKQETTPDQVEKLCSEAKEYRFASVCVNSSYVKFCADLLKGTGVKVCSVVGFPLGAMVTAAKAYEAQVAEYDGAQEIDMVLNVGALKSKGYDYVENDIAAVVKAVSATTLVKVILETCLLTDEEKVIGCELAKKAGAHFVKTSTGFSTGGATAADIALMRRVVGPNIGVKASGGIRDRKTVDLMVQAGASRVGASASVKIAKGEEAEGKGY